VRAQTEEKQCIRKLEQSGVTYITVKNVTAANVNDTTHREEYTQHRLLLLGITINLAKSILTPLLNI
jgi:hypothetical protein